MHGEKELGDEATCMYSGMSFVVNNTYFVPFLQEEETVTCQEVEVRRIVVCIT